MQHIVFANHIISTFLKTKSGFAKQSPEWLISKGICQDGISEAGFSCKLFSLLADVNQLRCEVIIILWHITVVLGWRISKKNKQRIKLWESLQCSWKQQSLMSELSQQPKLNNALKGNSGIAVLLLHTLARVRNQDRLQFYEYFHSRLTRSLI